MRIEVNGMGKRYRREWILRQVELSLLPGHSYAITGPNGAGKSTLLKLLSGHLTPSKGSVRFFDAQSEIPTAEVYRHISYAAPYIELIEELTLRESLLFHQRFRPFLNGMSARNIIELLAFKKAEDKQIRHFSSGMKQRLKLALALCSDASVILLDEPTTNLDRQGMDWYHHLVKTMRGDRLLIVASNVEEDFLFCTERIDILTFKNSATPA